ncbi:MAG TPA: hypothetical protein VF533_13775, partial [Solirubrobacteraceae bacterium]
VDYVANARSVGWDAHTVRDTGALRAALAATRERRRPAVLACHVEPHRALLGAGAFWDLGLPQVSGLPAVRSAAAAHAEAAGAQRFHGWVAP